MHSYFHINYELSKSEVHRRIDEQLQRDGGDYICVADGNILQMVHNDMDYRNVINGGMFSICDSSWVPLYIKWIYGFKPEQYCGSQIFECILSMKKYKMFFLGTSQDILEALKDNISKKYDSRISAMTFMELPFRNVDDFDYESIAERIKSDDPDIIWIALGAPKQEIFMSKLKPYLNRGVMIAVGAAFKFYSGVSEQRAPKWMIRCHLEFVYRLFSEPKKQMKRCWLIVKTLPRIFWDEKKRSREIIKIDK